MSIEYAKESSITIILNHYDNEKSKGSIQISINYNPGDQNNVGSKRLFCIDLYVSGFQNSRNKLGH